MKLPGQGFQKLEHEHGRHTLRRDRTHYHAAFVGGKNASGLNVKESRLISTKQKIDKCMRVWPSLTLRKVPEMQLERMTMSSALWSAYCLNDGTEYRQCTSAISGKSTEQNWMPVTCEGYCQWTDSQRLFEFIRPLSGANAQVPQVILGHSPSVWVRINSAISIIPQVR